MGFVPLANPPYTRYGGPAHIQADEPLGLSALAAYVRAQGRRVQILDALTTETGYDDCGNGFVKCGMSSPTAPLRAAGLRTRRAMARGAAGHAIPCAVGAETHRAQAQMAL